MFISLDDCHERMLRSLAMRDYKGRRGALSAVVSAGIEKVSENSGKAAALVLLEETLAEGVGLRLGGRKPYTARGELYETRAYRH